MIDTIFSCLNCRHSLKESDSLLVCKHCSSSWKVIDGVPQFIDTDFYWGEIPQAIMRKINKEVKQGGNWKDVFEKFRKKHTELERATNILTDFDRSRWYKMLPLPSDSMVLDIGAGTGTVAQTLSYKFKEIVALEPVLERIDFMRERFKQEQCNNIRVVRGDSLNIPFPEKSFDLVVMNGVLEWVPLADKESNPRKVQERVLKDIFKVLKPGGYVYVGIENRTFARHFKGSPDPHCGLRFVTILPRLLANIISRIKTGEPYRNYLYSYSGYKRLLKHCGYNNVEIYSSLPSYNDPKHIIPLEKKFDNKFKELVLPLSHGWKKAIKNVVSSLGLLRYCGYAYIIFGKKN